jgi:uncharacterized protein YndB with AHSA1/START domain
MNESNSSELKSRTWADGRDLILKRRIDSKPDKVYAAWTQPELIKQWFAPAPWSVSEARSDLRAGGSSLIVMRSPDGAEFPNRGVYLEVAPERRLVFTDAFVEAWTPSEKPFMIVILDFESDGTGTLYRATVRHWSEADRERHEAMGFHQGWALCAEQLAALVES